MARTVELSAAGHQDGAIARRLTAGGFRAARSADGPPGPVTRPRRQQQQPSLTPQFRGQEKLDGQWAIWGLARALGGDRNWLYARIKAGRLPATRHPVLGYYLIPDDPVAVRQREARRLARRPM